MGAVRQSWMDWRVLRLVILGLVTIALIAQVTTALGQVRFGATLTTVRGTVSVVRTNLTRVSPAQGGLILEEGDRVATVGKSTALVTFFDGSEIELGADTTIRIEEAHADDDLVTFLIRLVLGSAVHRVAPLASAGSSYRIVAGETVTEVQGTAIGTSIDGQGNVTAYLLESNGKVTFPNAGKTLHNGEACTATEAGDLVCANAKGKDVWSTLADGVSNGDSKGSSSLSNTPKSTDDDEKKESTAPTPTPTPTTQPTPTPTVTPTPDGCPPQAEECP